MKHLRIIALMCITLLFPSITHAQDLGTPGQVKGIITEMKEGSEETTTPGQSEVRYQYKIKLLEGTHKNEIVDSELFFDPAINNVGKPRFEVGNKVLLFSQESSSDETKIEYIITDHVRTNAVYALLLLFAAVVLIVNKKQGARALLSLLITAISFWYIALPLLFKGYSPIAVSGGLIITILGVIMYITHGFKRKTHVAVLATTISIGITIGLSLLFMYLEKLSGVYSEEVFYIADAIGSFDPRLLLLAGMIIASLGVLDDVTIGQTSIVEELHDVNPNMQTKELFVRGMRVGNDHAGSIVNTLILALAGSSLPTFILLYHSYNLQAMNGVNILNLELIATEITRMLTSSIGLIVAMPLTTLLAAYFVKKGKSQNNTHKVQHTH